MNDNQPMLFIFDFFYKGTPYNYMKKSDFVNVEFKLVSAAFSVNLMTLKNDRFAQSL